MKKIASIFFLVLFLHSHTEAHEFLRLPILFEHFKEHKQVTKDLSFWNFLVIHYQANGQHDKQDSQLPFNDSAHFFEDLPVAIPVQVVRISQPFLVKLNLSEVEYQEDYFEFLRPHIFQPPQGSIF